MENHLNLKQYIWQTISFYGDDGDIFSDSENNAEHGIQ